MLRQKRGNGGENVIGNLEHSTQINLVAKITKMFTNSSWKLFLQWRTMSIRYFDSVSVTGDKNDY